MSAAGTISLIVLLSVGVGSGLVLYALVRREREQGTVTDRETGEQLARRDTDEPEE